MTYNRTAHFKFYILVIFLFISGLVPVTGYAWGHEGHKIIADVATHYLTPKARIKVEKYLKELHVNSLADIANWADEYRHNHPETGPWHYVDIPLDAKKYDPAKYCKGGDCVIGAIKKYEVRLSDKVYSDSARAVALKFLVHFIADLHQPLHAADNKDRGGNDVHVIFMGDVTNLHRVWDYGIIDKTGMDATQYANYLISNYAHKKSVDINKIQKGSIVEWAMESHKMAVQYAYGDKPKDNLLTKKYYKKCKPIVDQQLFDAGVRLATVLNSLLRI
jgi:hypothetical protein